MSLFLIRHAKAEKRTSWDGPEPLRPLAPVGLRQAQAIARHLLPQRPARLLSSPHLRCRQSLQPLATAIGLPVETDERLAAGEDPVKALDLLGDAGEGVVVCTHNAIVCALVEAFGDAGGRLDGPVECDKGGVWELRDGRAVYGLPPSPGEGGDDGDVRLGVLDLGSTSFHLLVSDATPAGRLTPVFREREMLRLGALISDARSIPEDVCERAVESARHLRSRARAAGVDRFLAVGTAALRDARNGAALTARLEAVLGEPVRILDGEQEARLTFAAFRRRVLLPPGYTLGADLGGGSLELAVGDEDGVAWEATLALGVARLHNELVKQDPMRKREVRQVRARVSRLLAPCIEPIAARSPAACIATGGTARALGRLVVARRALRPHLSVNGLEITTDELEELANVLVRSSHDERLRMAGMRKQRADLLPTGALVLATLAAALDLPGYTLSDWGLREGVALDALGIH